MSLKKNITKSVFGKSILLLSSYALNIAVSRYYGATESGQIYYYYTLFSFLAVFLTAGMDTSLNYFLASGKLTREKINTFSVIMFAAVHMATFGMILVTFSLPGLKIPGNALLFFLFLSGVAITNIFSSLLNAEGRLFTYNLILSLGSIVLMAALFLNPAMDNRIPANNFLLYFGISTYAAAFLLVMLYLFSQKHTGYQKISAKEGFIVGRFAIIFLLNSLLSLLLVRLDYWFIKNSCTGIELGNFIQSSKFSQIPLFLPGMVSFALFPFVVKNAGEKNTVSITLLGKIYFYGAILFCLIFMLFGKFFFTAIYGSGFEQMPVLFTLLCPGIIFLAMSYPYSVYFPAVGKIRVLIFSLLLTLGLLTFCYLLIQPLRNIYAFAVTSSAGYIVYTLLLLKTFCKRNGLKLLNLFVVNKTEMEMIRKSAGLMNVKTTQY